MLNMSRQYSRYRPKQITADEPFRRFADISPPTIVHTITGLHEIAGQEVKRITRSFCGYLTEESVNRKCLNKDWTRSKMPNLCLQERNDISRQFARIVAILRFAIIARSRYPLSRITIYTHHSCWLTLINPSKLCGLTSSRQFLSREIEWPDFLERRCLSQFFFMKYKAIRLSASIKFKASLVKSAPNVWLNYCSLERPINVQQEVNRRLIVPEW
jgi:DNA-binding transcriptional regulator YdaS (Cro superfamily)